jgi:hypothetical protein
MQTKKKVYVSDTSKPISTEYRYVRLGFHYQHARSVVEEWVGNLLPTRDVTGSNPD